MIKANHPERGQTEFTQKMWDALGSNKQGWVQGVEKPAEIVDFEAKQLDVIGARNPAPPAVNSPPKAKRKSKKK